MSATTATTAGLPICCDPEISRISLSRCVKAYLIGRFADLKGSMPKPFRKVWGVLFDQKKDAAAVVVISDK